MKWKPSHDLSPPKLVLEQPPELNRLLLGEVMSRRTRWKVFFIAPFLFAAVYTLLAVVHLEIHMLNLWLEDKSVWDAKAIIMESFLPIFVFMIIFLRLEMAFISCRRSKRVVQLFEEGIVFRKDNFVTWAGVTDLRVEPIQGNPHLRKLIIEYKRNQVRRPGSIVIRIPIRPKHLPRKCFEMILRHPEQTNALQHEIEVLQNAGVGTSSLKVSNLPLPNPAPLRGKSLASVACTLAAIWLWIAGFGLIKIGFDIKDPPPSQITKPATLTKNATRMNRWLYSVFSTREEIIGAMLVAGFTLMSVGFGLFIYSIFMDREQNRHALGPDSMNHSPQISF